jgi:ABC-type oligopeptide transport system substrate-binding subunit
MSKSPTSGAVLRISAVAGLALIIAALIAGCGGGSSSSSTPAKPAYCSDVTKFETAVGKLTDSGSPSAIASNISNVVSTGQAAISAVKTAFAPQATALKSSLTALETSAKELVSSGTRPAALKQIPGQVTAVKSAGDAFVNAAHPKCS